MFIYMKEKTKTIENTFIHIASWEPEGCCCSGGFRGGVTGAPPPLKFDRLCVVFSSNKAQIAWESIKKHPERALDPAVRDFVLVMCARTHNLLRPPQMKILDPPLMLITRRALSLYKVYGDSVLLVLNGTKLKQLYALLALSRW